MNLTSSITTGAVIARNPVAASPFVRVLLVLIFLLSGGTMLSAQTITRNVVAGGVLDLNPVSEVFPPGGYSWLLIRHTTVPGTTKGTMSKTMLTDETVWGTTAGPNPFGPAASPTFTQNRVGGSVGFRYTSNGTGVGTTESIPIRFTSLTGDKVADYTLVINILPAGSGPQITTQPVPLQTVNPGASATLTVVATGTGLTYQWYEGVPPSMQSPMADATASSFATPVRPVGQYHYWVRVSNAVASVNSLGATVNVSSPPTARPGGPYTVGERKTITLSGLLSTDPDQASNTLGYKWDNDNNNIYGMFDTPYGPENGATVPFTAVNLEGPGTHPLRLQVSDNSDNLAYANTTITIVNTPPQGIFTTNGSAGLVSFSSMEDSPGDLAAGLQYSYDLNGDGTFEVAYSANASATVPAAYMAAYLDGQPVRGRVRDRDQGVSEYIANIYGRGILVTTLAQEENGGAYEIGVTATSLREAMAMAAQDNSPKAILFNPAILTAQATAQPCTMTFTISTPVAICGPRAGNGVVLTGNNTLRGFVVDTAGSLTLDRITMTGFTALSLAPDGPRGGAIYSEGTLTVRRSTLHGNRVTGTTDSRGGAIYVDSGPVTLENSTLFNNQSTIGGTGATTGGGMFARNSVVKVTNCTISGNAAATARNVYVVRDGASGGGSAAINNSIVTQAPGGTGTDLIVAGINGGAVPNNSGTNNIIRSQQGFSGTAVNADPMLAGLAQNGGTTPTLSLVRGSPAINRGAVVATLTTDQRGSVRPFARRYDIGALEFDGLIESLVVTIAADEDDGTSDALMGTGTSLREALAWAGDHAGADTITFAPALGGVPVLLSNGWNNAADLSALRVNHAVTVQGLSTAPGISIELATGVQKRHFHVEAAGNLTISNVSLLKGYTTAGGGSVWSEGSFKAVACAFSGNHASSQGGALYAAAAALTCHLENCTFYGNTTSGTGSAVSADSAQTVLRHVTITSNSVSGGTGPALIFGAAGSELRNCLVIGNNTGDMALRNGATLSALSTNNLLGTGGAGTLVNGENGNITGVPVAAARLGNFGASGVPTPVVTLEMGSIAVNQGAVISGLTTDQRGTPRPAGTAPDIGAFEDSSPAGKAGDADFDTLSNYLEYTLGTDIFGIDSDNDGYNDGTEHLNGSLPLVNTSVPPVNHVARVLGFGPGRGLDLAGTFPYAVNVGTDGAAGPAGSANFTEDNVAGVTVNAPRQIVSYTQTEFGPGATDATLENVYRSIRWNNAPVSVTLTNLTPGRRYKLQLLFAEAGPSNRTFDITVGGVLAVDNFNPSSAQGGGALTYAASAVVHEFTATTAGLTVTLDGTNVPASPGLDRNPILNGFTLEQGAFISPIIEWRSLHGLPIDGSGDLSNPSGDGVSNLLKYSFNLAPAAGDLNRANVNTYAPGGTSGLPAIQHAADGSLVFDFIRRKASAAAGIIYEPRITTDLVTWEPVSMDGAVITSVDAAWERVTLTVPAVAGGRLFGSVEVSVE